MPSGDQERQGESEKFKEQEKKHQVLYTENMKLQNLFI